MQSENETGMELFAMAITWTENRLCYVRFCFFFRISEINFYIEIGRLSKWSKSQEVFRDVWDEAKADRWRIQEGLES